MTTPPWGEQPDQPAGQQPPTSPYGQQQPPSPYSSPYGQQQPYGQPPLAQPGYGYTPPAPTNGMAIASLVVSIGGFFACCGLPSVVGAVLGHIARKQIRERGEQGEGMALAGIIVGWVAFGIFLLIAALYGAAIVAAVLADDSSTY